jgi:hypothetical protein
MKKILLFLLVGVISCQSFQKPNKDKSDTIATDISTNNISNNNWYDSLQIYSSVKSDSLFLDQEQMKSLIDSFRLHRSHLQTIQYGGGDCWGITNFFSLDLDTLIIDKYDCGDYGFGNNLFLISNDSIAMVRKYDFDWDPSDGNVNYNISEQIFLFNDMILLQRKKTIGSWKDFSLDNVPFIKSNIYGTNDYNLFLEEVKNIKKRETIE